MDVVAVKSLPFIGHHSVNPSPMNMVISSPKGPNKKDIAGILFSIETKAVLSIEQVGGWVECYHHVILSQLKRKRASIRRH
jgi:hypothetical protein